MARSDGKPEKTPEEMATKRLTLLNIVKSVVTRLIYITYGLIGVWRVVLIYQDNKFWIVAGALLGIPFELALTLYLFYGGEWKWFTPSVFFFLGSIVPSVWLLELHRLESEINPFKRPSFITNDTAKINSDLSKLGINVDLTFLAVNDEKWMKTMEQMLLLVLIICRWLSPKGTISRDQLSQLLLVYIGMGADILELLETLKEKTVRTHRVLTMMTLAVWSLSLLQYCLVLVVTRGRKVRMEAIEDTEEEDEDNVVCCCCPFDMISVLVGVCMQDAPFLCLRLTLIFKYGLVSDSNIFFTSKNTIVILLQLYRIYTLFHKHQLAKAKAKEPKEPTEPLKEGEEEEQPVEF